MSDMHQALPDKTETELSTGFIYENEHPQHAMPFTACVGDRRVEGKSISVTHAVVSGLMPPNANFKKVPTALQFNFEGFSVNLFVEVNVEKVGDAENPDLRLQFCDPTGSHLPTLRYIMNSHLAGDLVTVGRFLGYTGPTQVKTKSVAEAPGLWQRATRIIRQSALIALSLVLIALAANVVRERILFNYEGHPVVIGQSGETMRATSAGQITYVNADAGLGDVAYSIASNSGALLSVKMPCDCETVALADFYEGATILAGTPLLKLQGEDTEIEATAQVSFQGVARMLAGDTAQLEFTDGRMVPVTLQIAEAVEGSQANATVAADIVIPDSYADQITVGETARLRFKRNIVPAALAQYLPGAT